MTRNVEREPWERQPGEGNKAYAAFCMYRDLHTRRSLREVTIRFYRKDPAKVKVASRRIKDWSSKWDWVARAAAWDEERDRQAREAELQAIADTRKRQIRQAIAMQRKGIEAMMALRPEHIPPSEARLLIMDGSKLERINLGEPESIEEQRISGEVMTRTEYHERIELVLKDESARQQVRDVVRRAIERGGTTRDLA